MEPQSNAVGHAGRPPHEHGLDSRASKTLPSCGVVPLTGCANTSARFSHGRWAIATISGNLHFKGTPKERVGRAGVAQPGRAHPLGAHSPRKRGIVGPIPTAGFQSNQRELGFIAFFKLVAELELNSTSSGYSLIIRDKWREFAKPIFSRNCFKAPTPEVCIEHLSFKKL